MNITQQDPDENLRDHLKALYPSLSKEELEESLRRLKRYMEIAEEVARDTLRKDKQNKPE